jgi:ADP-ribose pyrophosphatase
VALAMPLPKLPIVELHQLEDLSPRAGDGFLQLQRRRFTLRYADGADSEPFLYDSVHRAALDAVVIAPHYRDGGRCFVYLRSAVRPPVFLRPLACRPLPEKATLGALWELPAGLVEAHECRLGEAGLKQCGARELEEELGFSVEPGALVPLGPATFPSAGVIGERHHYLSVEVDPTARREPLEDGSVLERRAVIAAIPLDEAIALTKTGELEDAKTEIALRRLGDVLLGR